MFKHSLSFKPKHKLNVILPHCFKTQSFSSIYFDIKEDILAIFFDFAKAFDLVQHRKMLEKFESKGYLPSWLISWLAAYLHNRKQRVVVGQIKTEWKPVEAGVIQGSVLGPILFLLFILDVNEYLPKETDLLKYADDILTYLLGKAIHQTE